MTEINNPPPEPDDQTLDRLLGTLAQQDREHRAPLSLQSRIQSRVGEQMAVAGASVATDLPANVERLLQWLRGHRGQAGLLGAAAFTAPLALGIFLALSQPLEQEELQDPTLAWVSGYQSLDSTTMTDDAAPATNQTTNPQL